METRYSLRVKLMLCGIWVSRIADMRIFLGFRVIHHFVSMGLKVVGFQADYGVGF